VVEGLPRAPGVVELPLGVVVPDEPVGLGETAAAGEALPFSPAEPAAKWRDLQARS